MSIKDQNEAIAILCGYYKDTENRWHRQGGAYRSVPSYTSDLKSMHEAENLMAEDQEWEFIKILVKYEQHSGGFPLLSLGEALLLRRAPAHERAEAFLKTFGKWKE